MILHIILINIFYRLLLRFFLAFLLLNSLLFYLYYNHQKPIKTKNIFINVISYPMLIFVFLIGLTKNEVPSLMMMIVFMLILWIILAMIIFISCMFKK